MIFKKVFWMCCLGGSMVLGQVPATWQTANDQLRGKLTAVNSTILSRWDGVSYPTAFSNDLFLANSNNGYDLINPTTQPFKLGAIDSALEAFTYIGLNAVAIQLQFPILVNTFPNADLFKQFYQKVVQKVRGKGMKLVIGCQATFVDTTFGEPKLVQDVLQFYEGLDNNRYRAEKLQMLQTIIDEFAPEYLVLEMEPETQTINLGHRVDFQIDTVVSYVNYFLSHLDKKTVAVGAGAGTWDGLEYFSAFASQTSIDFIAYHIYPPHFSYVDDMAFRIDSVADVHHKKLIIDEAWCYKATNGEVASITEPVATSAELYSRDMFDFWSPLDTLFIRTLMNLAQQSKVELVSFFWPTVMFQYLTYDSAVHGGMTPGEKLTAGQQAGYQKMLNKQLSPTGLFLQTQLSGPTGRIYRSERIPEESSLDQNFPNPFNPTTTIRFALDRRQSIRLTVHDLLGRHVAVLVNEMREAGTHTVHFDATGLPSGVYVYRLETSRRSEYRKALLLR